MDVKYAFLHGDLQEEIHTEQPPGYVQNDSSLVCRLKKSLYGLMLNLPFCMRICKKKSTWNNLLVMSRMTLVLFVVVRNLYGLRQAPRSWYAKMDSFLIDTGFSRCHFDPNVYTKKTGIHLIICVALKNLFMVLC
jgi:hypothetical protein